MTRGRAVIVLLALFALTTACSGHASSSSTPLPSTSSLPDIETMRCANTPPLVYASSSLPGLRSVAALEQRPLVGRVVHAGHGRAGPNPPIATSGAQLDALSRDVRAAAAIACQLATPEDAQRAGYVLSSFYTQGVGTHWTNWSLINKPFDPTKPSMLLYAPRFGETRLIGFSYWVRTPAPNGPRGFAGDDDHWHRHFGLCFDVHGMLQRENVADAQHCVGHWLNGADMWMLHAWIVPGDANAWGLFAPLNPVLCSRTVPDIARCPGF